jgi:putative ABC transport system permease protein
MIHPNYLINLPKPDSQCAGTEQVFPLTDPNLLSHIIIQAWYCFCPPTSKNAIMFGNYFKTAFRNLLRNKTYSAINMLGLAVGMAVFLLIAQYVRFERSYEDFVPDRANIYRVSISSYRNNELISASAENYPAVGPAMFHDIPQVQSFARLYNMGYKNNVIITNENAKPYPIVIKQHRFLYADSAFLPMMGYEMIHGNEATALSNPFSAVISEKYARIYFGDRDPIGQTLHMHDDDFNDELATVTGVFKEVPSNTHLKFDVLFSYKTLYARRKDANKRYDQNWSRVDMYTFVRLRPGTDPAVVEAQFPSLVTRYKPQLAASHEKEVLRLQPLSSIHLYSDLAEEPEANGNGTIVLFLGLIGIFVLVIAWINFINLATARAIGRAKEVGIYKVVGASRTDLITRFLAEAAMVNLFSLALAVGIVAATLTPFDGISGLPLDGSYLQRPWFLELLAVLWIAGTLLSGFYPAWVLSSFRPVSVLKGKLKSSSGGALMRKGLVVGQFVASVALITGTMIVYRQLHFMMRSDLGMDIDQVVVMDRPGIQPNDDTNTHAFRSEIDLFRNELKRTPDIEAVSNMTTVPGMLREWRTTVKLWGGHSSDSVSMRTSNIDFDFLKVFKMPLLAGRNFSLDYPHDPDTSAILTASAVRLLGFKNPQDAIGRTIVVPEWNNQKDVIVGVVNDYHQVSLKKPLEPALFNCDYYESEYYAVRVHTNDMSKTLDHMRASWNKAFPGNPFEYFFLDDYFNRQYANDRKFGQLFTVFASLAILISCLGLFGLSSYTASQRIKEIGIRKVLGASVPNITTMLSLDFLRLVLVSILIATPLTWLIMYSWLQSYAYRASIQWWVFVLADLIALVIALLTVSFQAIKAALNNPVKSLRSE